MPRPYSPKNMLLKLAWRNIWRNTRRTILTISGVAFGLGLCVYARALGIGFHNQMIRDAIHVYTGHIQIHALNWQDNKTLEYMMESPDAVFQAIINDPRIAGAAPRAEIPGLISRKLIVGAQQAAPPHDSPPQNNVGAQQAAPPHESPQQNSEDESGEENTTFTIIAGIDPDFERKMTSLPEKMRQGQFLSNGDPTGVFIGVELAKTLGVQTGDRVLLWTQNYYESLEAKYFFVRGIFKSGATDLDTNYVFAPLDTVQKFLQLDNMVTTVTLTLSNVKQLDQVAADLKTKLDPKTYEVLTWTEVKPEIWQYVVFDDVGAFIFLGILITVVVFGILNTQLMAVFERTREFGAMLALGMRPSRVALLVFIECTLMTSVGIVFGNLLGLIASYINSRVPIDLSSDAEMYEYFGIDPMLYAAVTPAAFIVSTALILGAALLISLWPAVRAARYKPVDALRYV